jgi:hypothetical protein
MIGQWERARAASHFAANAAMAAIERASASNGAWP